MDKLIIKLFGINRLNLIGWCFAGLFLICGTLFFILLALSRMAPGPAADSRPLIFLLVAIALLLLGIFGLLLSIYCAMFAEKLESSGQLKAITTETSAGAEAPHRDQFKEP
jgi:Co/Zn/Cd efflux system component